MTNQNQTYKQLRTLELKEIKHAVSEWGSILLNNLPDDTMFVAKIIGDVIVKEKDPDAQGNPQYTYMLPVEYYHKDLEGRPKFNVIISAGCYTNLMHGKKLEDGTFEPPKWTSFPDKTFINKRAFFKRIKGDQGRKLQFINVFEGGQDPIDTDDMFKKKERAPEEEEKTSETPQTPVIPPMLDTSNAPIANAADMPSATSSAPPVAPPASATTAPQNAFPGVKVEPKITDVKEITKIVNDIMANMREMGVSFTKPQWEKALRQKNIDETSIAKILNGMKD